MKIDILCVGKIKEEYFRNAIDEYKKRLSRYADVEIIEVADEATDDAQAPAREGERLIKKISDSAYVIALAIKGKKYTSESFSQYISDLAITGNSHIQFIIGGSMGLSDEVLGWCDSKLSFSDMTFPHQLMRVLFLEQLYRAFKIIKNEPYHK
ncbi:MAG: 23S rRNA (pseudouridine(1915)-N(3))-methyltransferase RlmH [Lachnospiraceae bacterium]|nr:23S rRNA (pseudouridine(1915)-N(3))-methyltransferase RlmH [Candidatus Minthocola equi]